MRYANCWVEIFNMSEKEKSSKNPGFFIKIDKYNMIYCTPQNTIAELYENHEYDHIFIITGQTEEGIVGTHFWRNYFGNEFDQMIRDMIKNGYYVEKKDEISPNDYQAWLKEHDAKLPTVELTERQESKVAFLGHLLQKEYLVPDDFMANGDLVI